MNAFLSTGTLVGFSFETDAGSFETVLACSNFNRINRSSRAKQGFILQAARTASGSRSNRHSGTVCTFIEEQS